MDEKTFKELVGGVAVILGLCVCMVAFLFCNISFWEPVEAKPETVEVVSIHTSKHGSYAVIRVQGSRQEHRQHLGGHHYAGRRYASLRLPFLVKVTATKYQRQYFGTTETNWSYPDLKARLNEAIARP